MEMIGLALFLYFIREMDLNNVPPELPISFSLGDFCFVWRTKVMAREALIRRYEEIGYNAILASTEPFILVTHARSRIVIFILT